MTVRFWDMDQTLLNNDCDVSWKLFLIEKGLAPREDLDQIVHFWKQYEEGRLDPVPFNEFQLREFAGRTETEIAELSREHFETIVRPKVYARALELVREQKASGEHTCMITATNIAIATPVAEYFAFDTLIATMLETKGKFYTGRIIGDYCAGEGKIKPMRELCKLNDTALENSWYYGDSLADLPVLEAVGNPVAANPRGPLRDIAKARNWVIMDF